MEGLVRIPCPRCSVREEITPPRAGVHGECVKCRHTWTWTAETLGALFTSLASRAALGYGTLEEHTATAANVWAKMGDVPPWEMDCDDALSVLGLRRWGVNPGYEEDGETWLYGPPGHEVSR